MVLQLSWPNVMRINPIVEQMDVSLHEVLWPLHLKHVLKRIVFYEQMVVETISVWWEIRVDEHLDSFPFQNFL